MSAQAQVGYISVAGAMHSMLRRHKVFDGLAAQFAATTLLGIPSNGPLARIVAGERRIEI